jgi:hypothetical protein
VLDEHVVFLERPGIEHDLKPFARRQLALGMLGLDALLAATQPRVLPFLFQLLQNVLHFVPESGRAMDTGAIGMT